MDLLLIKQQFCSEVWKGETRGKTDIMGLHFQKLGFMEQNHRGNGINLVQWFSTLGAC